MKLGLICPSLLLCSLVACGGSVEATPSTDGGINDAQTLPDQGTDVAQQPDTSVVEAGPFMPASHAAAPQVESYGGTAMVAPKIYPVFFAGDDTMQKQIETFLAALIPSSYWTATTSEYGVGNATVMPTIITSDTPPTTDDAMQMWLANMTDGTHMGWPKPDANTLYAVFLPDNAVITIPQYGQSCQSFGGYHFEATGKKNESIVYAVMPRCKNFGQYKGLDALTGTLSHELVEAATDPTVISNPAYAIPDKDHYVWALVPLGEVGDMCTYEPQSFQRLIGNGTYVVQRTWSNAAAKAGNDPCVPHLADPYFNSVPVLSENVTINFGMGQAQTKGVKIPVGTSKTIEVDLFSDAPTTDWTVQAEDVTSLFYNGQPDLTFSWDAQTGNNGTKLNLTITREKKGQYNGSEFVLYSQKGQKVANLWFGFVSN
jgi:hypothetical protein